MECFEIDQLGVQEMNDIDMGDVNGGIFGVILACVIIYIVIEAAANPNASVEAFKAGWNAA